MSDPVATLPPKASPESLALRAPPRPVTRLSRKALALLLGGAAVIIGGAGLWALRPPAKPAVKTDASAADRKPTAEGLLGLPTSYAGVTPGTPPPGAPTPPKLGPPLPGDLGVPIHNAEQAGALAAASPPPGPPSAVETAAETARQQRRQQDQAAVSSGLFAAASGAGAAPMGVGSGAAVGQPAAVAQAAGGTPVAPSHRDAFLKPDADAEAQTVSAHQETPPASPYVVMAGSTIAAALVTGLNSDLPGQVIATVTAPVYDTPTGRFLLIPQGARLLGTYDSEVAFGESRALLVWTRLILPDGASMVLDKVPATDAGGYAGVSDQVDNHWKQLVAGAALSTLLGAGAELAAPENQTSGSNTVVVATREGLQDSVNQVGQELTRKNLSIKPTITVRPGYPVRVLVNRDLVLKPYGER